RQSASPRAVRAVAGAMSFPQLRASVLWGARHTTARVAHHAVSRWRHDRVGAGYAQVAAGRRRDPSADRGRHVSASHARALGHAAGRRVRYRAGDRAEGAPGAAGGRADLHGAGVGVVRRRARGVGASLHVVATGEIPQSSLSVPARPTVAVSTTRARAGTWRTCPIRDTSSPPHAGAYLAARRRGEFPHVPPWRRRPRQPWRC